MAKIDDLLTEYARAVTNDRCEAVTITVAQSERIKAARKAIVDYMLAADACAVCGQPVQITPWCSIACMEKHIGPTCAAGARAMPFQPEDRVFTNLADAVGVTVPGVNAPGELGDCPRCGKPWRTWGTDADPVAEVICDNGHSAPHPWR